MKPDIRGRTYFLGRSRRFGKIKLIKLFLPIFYAYIFALNLGRRKMQNIVDRPFVSEQENRASPCHTHTYTRIPSHTHTHTQNKHARMRQPRPKHTHTHALAYNHTHNTHMYTHHSHVHTHAHSHTSI